MTKRPIRTCAVCRVEAPQELLDRLTLRAGELRKDDGPRAEGRGVYAHPEHDLTDPKIASKLTRSVNRGGR